MAATGDGVRRPRPGDAVVVANSAPCGAARACREGRAEPLRDDRLPDRGVRRAPARAGAIVARNTLPLPTGLAPALGAMAEPLACALHTAGRCGARPGDVVLVLGGGVQGQLLAGALARRGCRVHLRRPPPRAPRARPARRGGGGPRALRATPVGIAALRRALPGGAAPTLVVEAVGRPETWRAAAALARPGGEVMLHGGLPAGAEVAIPAQDIHYERSRSGARTTTRRRRSRRRCACCATPPFAVLGRVAGTHRARGRARGAAGVTGARSTP